MKVPLTVGSFLKRAGTVYSQRIGIVDEPGAVQSIGQLTYADMAARAEGMAASLDRMGVGPGQRVGIVSPNSAKFLISFFGVSGWGRVLVPINFRLNADEIAYIIEHSGTRVLLVDPELAGSLSAVKVERMIVMDNVDDSALFAPAEEGAAKAWDADEDAVATLNYTSGTTARPKGVRLTHRNCWLNATTFGWHVGVSDRDVLLHTLPMFHANGWGIPFAATAMGARQIVLRKIDGKEIMRRVEEHGVSLACAAPAVVSAILDGNRDLDSHSGPAAQERRPTRIVVAGAPPPSKTIEEVENDLGWEFIQLYGLTETSPLLTINRSPQEWDSLDPSERSHLLSRAGVAAVGVEVQTDDEGEILTRSNNVFDGYWEQPEETSKAIRNGWFHTGDGGYLDGPYLTITDRKKDVIITGGENVSSIEVEDCLYQHPAVAEAAVIGIPDDRWGETVKAVVVLRSGYDLTPESLIDHCRELLAHYKCPTSVDFEEVLPRTATGKLQKFKLREKYWSGGGPQIR